jgi:hypothetical protein
LKRKKIVNRVLKAPAHIKEVGLSHVEQIDLLRKILDILLSNQCALIDNSSTCSQCGRGAKKAGTLSSAFHSVYTDHNVKMARRICPYGWRNKPSIEGWIGRIGRKFKNAE